MVNVIRGLRADLPERLLLLERVDALVRAGKTLDQIKQEFKMPEYTSWAYQERMPTNIEAAYRAATGK